MEFSLAHGRETFVKGWVLDLENIVGHKNFLSWLTFVMLLFIQF